jgi:Tol biopolymer transport system component/TolA-binding protein
VRKFLANFHGKKFKHMKSYIILSIYCLGFVVNAQCQQKEPEVLLTEGIYQEEIHGELNEAMKTYKLIVDQYPDNREITAEALLHLGFCYEKLESPEAYQTYQEIINKYADQKDKAALALSRVQYLDDYAAEIREKAEKHISEGNDLYKVWEYESAINEYESAIRLNPNSLIAQNAKYYMGQSYFKSGEYEKALATFKDLVEENPESTIAPVTELMIAQVQHAIQDNKDSGEANYYSDKNTITDPVNGISYTKIKTFTGKNDLISYVTGGFNLSPDCRFLVLENQVVPVDGSSPFKLVEMEALRAVYSPNMKKAAFYADSAIWIISVSPETGHSTEKPKKLVKGFYRFEHPVAWSPDGRKLVYCRRDKEIINDIWTVSVSDGKQMPVTNTLENEVNPSWSPDGKTIIYKKDGGIWQNSINGDMEKMIVKNAGSPRGWSPDGNWLFHSDWENNHLYSMKSGTNHKVASPSNVGTFIGFSSEGEKMLYYRSSSDANWPMKVVSIAGGPSFTPPQSGQVYGLQWSYKDNLLLAQGENVKGEVQFKIIPLTGENPINVNIETNIEGNPFPFVASPDLTKMAFSVKRDDGLKDLYVAPLSMKEAKNTEPPKLIFDGWDGGAYNVKFSWSPDGSKIALIHDDDIWIISLDIDSSVRITNSPEEERWVDWSPNGTMISYIIRSHLDRLIYIIPSSGETPKLVTKVNVRNPGGSWSPDSKSMAIFKDNDLQIISLDGKNIKSLLNTSELGIYKNPSSAKFSPDGRYIAFIGMDDTSEKSLIFIFSLEDQILTRVASENLNDYKYGLDWSPDSRWLSYLAYEEVKVRPEGTMWETDFKEILEKIQP